MLNMLRKSQMLCSAFPFFASFIHSWDQCTLRWWLMMRPPKVLGNPLSAMNRTSAVFLIWGSPHLFFLDICVPPVDEINSILLPKLF